MPKEIQLWRVQNGRLEGLSHSRLDLESRLEDWLHRDVSLLGQQLLIIGRQVPTDFGGFIDLLCLDAAGDLVIIELKRNKTPREVTAQILDYASWAAELSAERVAEIADGHLGAAGPLESAFRATFDEDLPEVLNDGLKMLLVAVEIDAASERIIRYLSDRHGVSINAVCFQYFRMPGGEELLGRVHFLEPEQVEQKARSKGGSKRRPALSLEELEAVAEENGVGELYRSAFAAFQPLFNYTQTTRSALCFAAPFGDRTGRVLNLLPTGASAGELPYQLYTARACQRFDVEGQRVVSALPAGSQIWSYDAGDDPWWNGHTGSFRSREDIDALRRVLSSSGDGASSSETQGSGPGDV